MYRRQRVDQLPTEVGIAAKNAYFATNLPAVVMLVEEILDGASARSAAMTQELDEHFG